uniref:Pyrin domain-containing protein n=1 Tax=Xiphophorus couchianus TaxID=32473 RepID=A0A3B5KRF7_9TELE
MPRSVKQLLAETLEDLKEESFQKFVFQLLDRSEEPRVRRCRVEGKSRLDVVDVLVSTFTEVKAVDVTKEILRSIGCNQQAEELSELNWKERIWFCYFSLILFVCFEHFVDRHRTELIQRVTTVAPILDKLLKAKVIQNEAYDEIMGLRPSQNQMRRVYGSVQGAGRSLDIIDCFRGKFTAVSHEEAE